MKRRVFVVLGSRGPIGPSAAASMRARLCGAICVYWPQLAAQGWRMVPAELH
jgi:hypothetical protein